MSDSEPLVLTGSRYVNEACEAGRRTMGVFRRRRQVVCSFIGVVFMFTLLLLSTSDITSDEDIMNQQKERYNVEKPLVINSPMNGPAASSRNNQTDSVVVQVWPKDTLEIIRDVFKKSTKKRQDELIQAETKRERPAVIEEPVRISQDIVPCHADNTDCHEVRQLLKNWPEGKPRAAFYFLTYSKRLGFMKKVLESVDMHFNNRYRYPIIIFHESDLVEHIPTIRSYTKSKLSFQEIVFAAPDFIKKIPEQIACYSSISYRHMCRFHAKGVFQQPILRGFDYFWRLDDDSLILRNVTYDVFQFMRDKKLLYGYSWRHLDNYKCTEGLWNATYTYVKENHITPYFLSEWQDPWLYYNNFEITDLNVWLSEDYAKYIEYIDRLGGIFYHRWGDAPIRGLSVAIFIPKEKVHRFIDIGYQHGSYINK